MMSPLPKSTSNLLSHHFSTAAKATARKLLRQIPNVPSRYKSAAISQAQTALTDYLHSTRSLPFTYAEHITKNSPFCLSNVVKKIKFSAPTFSKSFQRLLRYHPINEFEFFFESIGIDHSQIGDFLPTNKFFFDEDKTLLDVACTLSRFGFPWNMLGKLYREEQCIFSLNSEELQAKLLVLKGYGWGNFSVAGTCLAFPHLLRLEVGELCSGDVVALLDELKRLFVELDIPNSIEENVETWYEICRKVKVFYDLGLGKGREGELLGRKKDLVFRHPEEVLVQKVNYFCRLGVKKEDVCMFLLERPEVFSLELEKPVISTLGMLKHLGMDERELEEVSERYPHAIGRNKMANLPHLMRALDLHEWFFSKIKNDHELLANYVLSDSEEEGIRREFSKGLEKIQSSHVPIHELQRLNFMHSIGFGENPVTLKVLNNIHGKSTEIEKRFDFLLYAGIEFSQLCLMMSRKPKIMNQNPEYLKEKVNFLCGEMKSSVQYLCVFPGFLCFDLENRIKPRYRFYAWLNEKGLRGKGYSFSTLIATSEKTFVTQAFKIHPAAPKHWFECFLQRKSFEAFKIMNFVSCD